MKAAEIKLGQHYLARVSGRLVTVRVDAVYDRERIVAGSGAYGRRESIRNTTCYRVTNTATGRTLEFHSAAKFRGRMDAPATAG